MAIYAGETIRIKVTATDYDGEAITGEAATPPTGTVELYDADGAQYLAEDLAWESTKTYWFYDWDTVTGDVGTYKIRARFIGVGDVYDTWEYGRIQVKTNPVTLP